MQSKKLRGSTLALVDRNASSLDIVRRLADRLNRDWDAGLTITAHTHHRDALDGASFVVNAIEVGPREGLWKSDFEIPLKYGVRQPYAENGGPGGFAHAARNVGPILEIVRDMEQACPDAWFINYTNPMVRICDLVNRHSKIKVVGLCHQLMIGYVFVGMTLGEAIGVEVPEGINGMHAGDPLDIPKREEGAGADPSPHRHPRGRDQPFLVDSLHPRQAHRRGPLPAVPRALGIHARGF